MPNTVLFRRSPRRIQGFTLIELMIVIAIIAILAGIMIPNSVKSRDEARLTATKENLKNIGTALEMYAADNAGYYPTELKKLTPDYLKTVPTCPWGGRRYDYQFSVNPNKWGIYAIRGNDYVVITSAGDLDVIIH